MADAWVVRPKPHGTNRLDEFLDDGIIAIGWPDTGNLTKATKGDIRSILEHDHDWSNQKTGQQVGQINRFVNEISSGDHVLVPSGGDVYVGKVTSEYRWRSHLTDEGYAHQRDVEWCFEGGAVSRSSLPGRVHDSLKGRLTVFATDGDRVDEFVEGASVVVNERNRYAELQHRYLERLRDGDIPGINANSFEGEVVRTVLDNYFPSISRQATTSDETGDTDLMAELPGGVTVRVQVKHFYSDQGELGADAVEQLARSMSVGDHGIVVTSTDIGDAAEQAAETADHDIGLIGGEEFVELLFEDLRNYTEEELGRVGLATQPPTLRQLSVTHD